MKLGINRLLTFFSIIGLATLDEKYPLIFGEFQALIGLYKPDYIKWDEVRKMNPNISHLEMPKMEQSDFRVLLRAMLQNHGLGLPATSRLAFPKAP